MVPTLEINGRSYFDLLHVAFEFGNNRIDQISWLNSAWLVSRLDGLDLGLEARWLGFWLEVDLGLAWSDHGSMARIAAQWLRGSDLQTVLTRDFSSVARWLGLISAHEDKIKKVYPTFFFIFFFPIFEIRNLIFFFLILQIK